MFQEISASIFYKSKEYIFLYESTKGCVEGDEPKLFAVFVD